MADNRDIMQSREQQQEHSRRPSLLPAFEPFSSSPIGLPRPSTAASKRKFDDILDERLSYPTPIPTSSTLLPSSSPSRVETRRPALDRAVSTLSERAPLGDVPRLDLLANGEPVLMGRSSNSSDYQLSANRHISRVHVKAIYRAPSVDFPSGKVEVTCMGWNGAKVHCRGQIVGLAKGEVFVSDRPMAQIIVDVQDTRVMLVWPKEEVGSRSPWAVESPVKRWSIEAPPPMDFASSPPPMLPPRMQSPVSPTPAVAVLGNTFASTLRSSQDDASAVQVYEDRVSPPSSPARAMTPEPVLITKESIHRPTCLAENFLLSTSSLAPSVAEPEEFSEHDEENDPIVHSFGPFGENILSRFESFQPTSPERSRRKPLAASSNSPSRAVPPPTAITSVSVSPVKNHVINQLAYSRVHALPLSTLHSNLPAELRSLRAPGELKLLLDGIACVGEISREGKDAAGKLLESEFYYVPEGDEDEGRKEIVAQSLGKTSMRGVRKSHKVGSFHSCPRWW